MCVCVCVCGLNLEILIDEHIHASPTETKTDLQPAEVVFCHICIFPHRTVSVFSILTPECSKFHPERAHGSQAHTITLMVIFGFKLAVMVHVVVLGSSKPI